jgi:eukaryotic-like serine/threonine-protein kinase
MSSQRTCSLDARPGRPDHVYLSDFGLTKDALSTGLTGLGDFLGTPGYSAPEQIQGQPVDARTDQYALACTAFELLAGEPPFERDQGLAVIWAHLNEPPPSLASRRTDLPGAVDAVLARGLAKHRDQRFPSCQDFAEALRAALGLAPYDSWPSPVPPSQVPQPPAASRHDLPTVLAGGTTVTSAVPAVPVAGAGRLAEPGSGGREVTSVAFSPDGATLAVADMAGHVRLCAPANGAVLADLADPERVGREIQSVAFSADGLLLAIGGADGRTRLWDTRTAMVGAVLANPGSRGVCSVAFSPGGSVLAVADDNGSVYLWPVGPDRPPGVLAAPGSGGVLDVAFSPDRRMLAAGDGNGLTYLWDVEAGSLMATLTPGSANGAFPVSAGEAFSVAFTADGSVLATAHGDGSIRLWDSRTAEQVTVLAPKRSAGNSAYAVAFRPGDGAELAAGYARDGIRMWDTERGRPTSQLGQRDQGETLCLAFAPDGTSLATGSSSGEAWLWNLWTGSRISVLSPG